MRDLRAARRSADVSKRKRRRAPPSAAFGRSGMLERRSAFNQSGRGSCYARLETCPSRQIRNSFLHEVAAVVGVSARRLAASSRCRRSQAIE